MIPVHQDKIISSKIIFYCRWFDLAGRALPQTARIKSQAKYILICQVFADQDSYRGFLQFYVVPPCKILSLSSKPSSTFLMTPACHVVLHLIVGN